MTAQGALRAAKEMRHPKWFRYHLDKATYPAPVDPSIPIFIRDQDAPAGSPHYFDEHGLGTFQVPDSIRNARFSGDI
jgi:hypothetical protein